MNDKPIADLTVEELERLIEYHDYQYWALNAPVISDEQYDLLHRTLKERNPDSPALDRVGPDSYGPDSFGNKVTHQLPMLSLDKCYSDEEFGRWLDFVTRSVRAALSERKLDRDPGPAHDLLVAVSPKIDGVAAALRYDEAGQLVQAATRGDGQVGEDFTRNARLVSGIPWTVTNGPVEVRGEVYMAASVFGKKYRESFSNPRNLTAGTLKQKEGNRQQLLDLTFAAYDLIGTECASEQEKVQVLTDQGFFPVVSAFTKAGAVPEEYLRALQQRADRDFEADGIVVKLNDVQLHDILGVTAHHPRYAIAYKFQGDTGITRLVDVTWSVSRTATITPVANIQPVALSGATVSRSTLHNIGIFKSLGLKLGDKVQVTRRGGVIPNIETSLGGGTTPVRIPTRCPSCNAETLLAAPHCFVGGFRLSRTADEEELAAIIRHQKTVDTGKGILLSLMDTSNRVARKNGDGRYIKALTWKKGDDPAVRRETVARLTALPSIRHPHAELLALLVFDPRLERSWQWLGMVASQVEPQRVDLRILLTPTSRFDEAPPPDALRPLLATRGARGFFEQITKLRPEVLRLAGPKVGLVDSNKEGDLEANAKLAWRLSDDLLTCSNPAGCRDARTGTLEHFISTIGVDGFGRKILETLFDNGLLTSERDFFRLEPEHLIPLERMGEILAAKLVSNVQEASGMELSVFLQALGIDELARHVSALLQREYGDLERVLELSEKDLVAHDSIAFGIAHQVVQGLRKSRSRVEALLEFVTIKAPRPEGEEEKRPFSGLSFVFTGKMSTMGRKEAEVRVAELGGEAPGGVTTELSYLVVGDEGSPLFGVGKKGSKMLKAEKYNSAGADIKVVSETRFLEMLEESS